jgi:signal transduction histidine kinase
VPEEGLIYAAARDVTELRRAADEQAALRRVATAIANAASRSELAASRARVVSAADDARRRIERDLHDGVQQRLVGVALQLREAEVMAEDAPPEVREQLSRIAQNLASTVDDLRGGLGPAVRTLARRSAVAVELEMPAELDLPDPVEVAAYYVVSEALTNAAKHAGASVVEVVVAGDARALELTIRDDGMGGATRYGHAGSGLIGLTDRVEALGGVLRVTIPLDVARAAAAPSAEPQRAGRFRSR